MQRNDETTDRKFDHYAGRDTRRTALIIFAVVAGVVLIGAMHLLGVTPHGG